MTFVQVVGGCVYRFFPIEKCLVLLMNRLVNKIVSLNLLLDFSKCKKSTSILFEGHGNNVGVISAAARISSYISLTQSYIQMV